MNAVDHPAGRWIVSARPLGEVLVASAEGEGMVILACCPAGHGVAHLERRLREVIAKSKKSRGEPGLAVPAIFQNAVSRLLGKEFRFGAAGRPGALVLHHANGETTIALIGMARHTVSHGGTSAPAPWARLADRSGREALAYRLDADPHVHVTCAWADEGNAGDSAELEAEWREASAEGERSGEALHEAASEATMPEAVVEPEAAGSVVASQASPSAGRGRADVEAAKSEAPSRAWRDPAGFLSWLDRMVSRRSLGPTPVEPSAEQVPTGETVARADTVESAEPIVALDPFAESVAPASPAASAEPVAPPAPAVLTAPVTPMAVTGSAAAVTRPVEIQEHELRADLESAVSESLAPPALRIPAIPRVPSTVSPVPPAAPSSAPGPPPAGPPSIADLAPRESVRSSEPAPPPVSSRAVEPATAPVPEPVPTPEPEAVTASEPEAVTAPEPQPVTASEPEPLAHASIAVARAPSRPAPARHIDWPEAHEDAETERSSTALRTVGVVAAAVLLLFGLGWVLGTFQGDPTRNDASGVPRGLLAFFMPRYELDVTSQPAGAQIVIDGRPTGRTTPARLALKPGAHKVRLSLGRHGSATFDVQGQRGDRVPLDAALLGSVQIEADGPTGILVAIDGTQRGYAPVRVDRLAAGPHDVQFSGPGLPVWGHAVDVRVGQTATITARPIEAPDRGVLEVRAMKVGESGETPLEGAAVYVDGQLRGRTPLTLELEHGPHSVRVQHRGEDAPTQVIDLPGGNQRFAQFVLGADTVSPRLVPLGEPQPFPRDRPALVGAAMNGVAEGEIQEMWLHARTPEGTWRRFPMALLRAPGGVAGVAVYPPTLLDASGRTAYYVSALITSGDEFFTELQAPRREVARSSRPAKPAVSEQTLPASSP